MVGIGGGIGAMMRFFFSLLGKPGSFPVHTLLVNIFGSLLIGIIFALSLKNNLISDDLKLFLATGICGGFTTFSAFSLETMQLLRSGNYVTAGLYILISVFASVAATFIGYSIINH